MSYEAYKYLCLTEDFTGVENHVVGRWRVGERRFQMTMVAACPTAEAARAAERLMNGCPVEQDWGPGDGTDYD